MSPTLPRIRCYVRLDAVTNAIADKYGGNSIWKLSEETYGKNDFVGAMRRTSDGADEYMWEVTSWSLQHTPIRIFQDSSSHYTGSYNRPTSISCVYIMKY